MDVLTPIAFSLIALILLLLAGYSYQRVGSSRDAKKFPAPGKKAWVGQHRLHYLCRGEGAPTVVFDSALGSSSLSWALVASQVAELTQTCVYDRAGCGWSDFGPLPRTVDQIVQELEQLLTQAIIPPPYLLVGHSYGGLTMRLFAGRFPQKVAGLILLDPADPEQWTQLSGADRLKIVTGARLARRGALVSQFGLARLIVRLGTSGARGPAQKLTSWLSNGLPPRAQTRFLMPMERLPEVVRKPLKWFWTRPEFYRTLASQIETVPQSALQVSQSTFPEHLPLTVVSAENQEPSWIPRQRLLAELSTRGRHVLATKSSHWIPVDRPDLVVSEIQRMVLSFREKAIWT